MAKANPYTPEAMTARFWELEPLITAVEADMAPLQAEHDEIANYRRDDEVRIANELKVLNGKRADLMMERGTLAKALGGRTGESATAPYDHQAVTKFHAENPTPQDPIVIDDVEWTASGGNT